MASIAWKQAPTEEMLWHCLYMNIIQSVIRFKVVDVLVGSASQYQNKRVPDGWGCSSSSSSSCPSPASPCCTLSYLISPSSCPAPLQPRPPEARGRRGGTGACDWPLHCTACRAPAEQRRERWLQAENSTPRDRWRWCRGRDTVEQFWEQCGWLMATKTDNKMMHKVKNIQMCSNVFICCCEGLNEWSTNVNILYCAI